MPNWCINRINQAFQCVVTAVRRLRQPKVVLRALPFLDSGKMRSLLPELDWEYDSFDEWVRNDPTISANDDVFLRVAS